MLFQQISIPFLVLIPHPSGNSIESPYFSFKILAFDTPHPLGISIGLPWGGYGYFLELHIRAILTATCVSREAFAPLFCLIQLWQILTLLSYRNIWVARGINHGIEQSVYDARVSKFIKQHYNVDAVLTVKLRKPWTPEILMECYCVARKKPIRREKTKPQTATVISFWFWGLLACPELYFDWALDNQHSWNISGVHGFLSLIVIFSQHCSFLQQIFMPVLKCNIVQKTSLTVFK